MRWFFLVLISFTTFLGVACSAGTNTSALTEAVSASSCLTSLTFRDLRDRWEFVTANAANHQGARQSAPFVHAENPDQRTIEVISSSCSEERTGLQTDHRVVERMTQRDITPAQANELLSRWLLSRRDEHFRWACIVRVPHAGFALRIKEAIVFSGLRK